MFITFNSARHRTIAAWLVATTNGGHLRDCCGVQRRGKNKQQFEER